MRTLPLLLAAAILVAGCTATYEGTPPPRMSNETLERKQALVDEYSPGDWGMPGPVADEQVQDELSQHPDLRRFVTERYNTSTDLDVYHRMQQFHRVTLRDNMTRFTVKDGQTCELRIINGTIRDAGDGYDITATNETTKKVPC